MKSLLKASFLTEQHLPPISCEKVKGLTGQSSPINPKSGLHVQETPSRPFGKISSSLPCLLPFPSLGHVRAEVEERRQERPPRALDLAGGGGAGL